MTITDHELYSAYIGFMQSALPDIKKPGYKWWKAKYNTGATFPFKSSGEPFTMLAGIAHSHLWIALDFNANHLTQTQKDWDELQGYLEMFFPNGFATLYHHARMRCVEFAVDIESHDLSDTVVVAAACHSSNLKFEKVGTIYLGEKVSAKSYTIYDKAKELADKGKPCSHTQLLRVEAKLRHVKATLQDIKTLSNPFSKLVVADRAQLLLHKPKYIWQHIGPQIQAGAGVPEALLAHPASVRRKVIKQLREFSAPWWNPILAWEKVIESSLSLMPTTS